MQRRCSPPVVVGHVAVTRRVDRYVPRSHDKDALLAEIADCSTSGELLSVLRENESVILSGTSGNTTTYLSQAWDVLLQQHHGGDVSGRGLGGAVPLGGFSAESLPNDVRDGDSNGDVSASQERGGADAGRGSQRQRQRQGQGQGQGQRTTQRRRQRTKESKNDNTKSNNRMLQGYMLKHTMPLVAEFTPASISMIARAMVATKTGAAVDIVSISTDIQSRMVRFEPGELCMALWAMSSHPGMSEEQKQSLFKSLATLVRQGMGMDNFTAKDLSILVWAVGHVAYRDRVLLDAAEMEAVKKHGDFTAEDLSRLFHGFASVNYNPHTLLPHVCMRYSAPNALEEFASRDLALLIVSLGKLVVEPPSGFCKALVSRARDLVPASSKASNVHLGDELFDVHLNSLVMWSFARLGLKKTAYMTRSLKFVFLQGNVERHELEDLIAVMWACCRLDVELSSGQVARLSSKLLEAVSLVASSDTNCNDLVGKHASALCRGFRYVSMLYSKRKDKGRDRINDESTESNVRRIVDDIFRGGLADRLSPWELASVVVALGGFSLSVERVATTSPKSTAPTLPLRRIQRHLISTIPHVDSTLLPKLVYTIAKLGLATNNATVTETLSETVITKSGVLNAQGLVQTIYSYAMMGIKGRTDVARALAPKVVEKCGSLSSKDRARACFSMYKLAKQSGDRGSELHAACKDMMLVHVTEADVAALDATSLFGLVLAFGSVVDRHGADPNAKAAVRRLRGWLVESLVTRCRGFTSVNQLVGIQQVLVETGEVVKAGTAEKNVLELINSRLAELK